MKVVRTASPGIISRSFPIVAYTHSTFAGPLHPL